MPLPLLAIGAAAAGAGGLGSSLAGMFQSKGQALTPRDVARGTLAGYQNTAPGYAALNQAYSPFYLGLGNQNLAQLMFGTPASSEEVMYYKTDPNTGRINYKTGVPLTVNTPAAPGYLDIMRQAMPGLSELNLMARQADVSQAGQLAPLAQATWANLFPGQAALQAGVGADALRELNLGGTMSPEVLRQVQQSIRGNSRGMGWGPSDIYTEAMGLGQFGQQLRQQRQNYALGAMQGLAGTQPDFMSWVLNRGNANQVGSLLGGLGNVAYNPVYSPSMTYNPTAGQVAMTGEEMSNMQAMQQANALGGLGYGMMGLGSSLFNRYLNANYPGTINPNNTAITWGGQAAWPR